MPTILTHAVSGLAIGGFSRSPRPRAFWVWTAVCAMLPDADVIAFPLGIPYGHVLGHRGISHSLVFAALVGGVAAWKWGRGPTRWALFLHFFVVTASHGFLDAFTNGGLGVAFFAPFNDTRYFFPWRPIQVSPIGVGFFIARDVTGASYGVRVLASEFWYVWLPSAVVALAGWALRSRRSAR
jgi:inner membrane protein